jgi:hypothetical protein
MLTSFFVGYVTPTLQEQYNSYARLPASRFLLALAGFMQAS